MLRIAMSYKHDWRLQAYRIRKTVTELWRHSLMIQWSQRMPRSHSCTLLTPVGPENPQHPWGPNPRWGSHVSPHVQPCGCSLPGGQAAVPSTARGAHCQHRSKFHLWWATSTERCFGLILAGKALQERVKVGMQNQRSFIRCGSQAVCVQDKAAKSTLSISGTETTTFLLEKISPNSSAPSPCSYSKSKLKKTPTNN